MMSLRSSWKNVDFVLTALKEVSSEENSATHKFSVIHIAKKITPPTSLLS